MQQRLLAMLQNELPQPWRGASSERVHTARRKLTYETLERKELRKRNVQLRAQIAMLRLEVSQLSLVLMAEGAKSLL
ncbi:hypothetical protein COOONC_08049 [Cooperia oncophora]